MAGRYVCEMVMGGTVKRFIRWALCGALLVLPAMVDAADKTIGVIMSGNLLYYQEAHKAFVKAMAREGFDFKKVDTILQMPAPDTLSWVNASRKLLAADVDLLVTYGVGASLAAVYETKSIPVVFAAVYDPARSGVLAKNSTGMSSKVPLTSLLKYLKKLKPFTRLAVVYTEIEPDTVRQVEEVRQLESQYGFQTLRMAIKKSDDAAMLAFANKADAVLITTSTVAGEAIASIVRLAREAKVPTASQLGKAAEQGVVLCLSPSAMEQGEAAGRIASRILRGESPTGIPAESPRLVELVVNLKEADAIGLKVPMDLINDATKVIK